ncbi:reverse transcriptase domain-containing protein [Tanacetum coccineum]
MRTRNSNFLNNSPVTIPRRQNKRRAPNVVEPELRTIVEVAPMADNRTMEELLQAPTEGYGEAIVIQKINANHFVIKTNLLQLVQASPFHGFERDNPHTHINNFKRITSTLRFRDVPNDVIKLMMFPYSLEGNARIWYDKEPPNSILTWEDLVTKFVNQFFPHSKTTHLKNEISCFTQKFDETFSEAWERFKEMLRACPHHGFSELTQIDTFYNGLNDNDQDSLNAAAGGNLLSKTTREALNIIENKSKVRYSRNKSNVSRVNTNSRESSNKTDERIDKLADQISTLVEIVSKKVVTPATVKAVEESCVYCGGAHTYYNCPNTDSNQSSVCAAMGAYNQVAPPNRVSNHMAPPGFAPVQNNSQNRYNQNQVERETKVTTDKEQTNFQGSTAHIQPPVNPIPIPEPDVSKTLPKPNISYPSRLNDQKFREKASNQIFSPTIKNLLMSKDKLFELAKIPLNENCSAMLLKKLLEKLGDPSKFLIPCNFSRMDGCHALADLGASINLMPLFIWKKLSLPELTPTRMTLELADRSITRPKGLAEDVFINVGSFHFPTNFVVVDFEANPRVSLILGRSFLRTGRALINDSFEEVLRFKKSNHFSSGSTTPFSYSRPSFTSFETSDLILEEFADELALLDPFPPGNEDVDFEADLKEIELFTNEPALACLPPPRDDDDDKSFLKEDILEDVKSKDSNVSNFDELILLNTPLFDEDERFDPGGEIDKFDAFMNAYNDSEGDVLEILHNTTHNLFPGVFLDHDPISLKNEPDNDDLMTKDKVFDPRVMEKFFSPSYVRLSSKDRHYLFFTVVFSFGSEDTIFDPGIYAFHFSFFEPVAFESQMEVCSSTCFIPINN